MSEASGTPQIHPNLKLLSHSSLNLLHSCPRKYQIYKLTPQVKSFDQHTDFGTALGTGIQSYLQTNSMVDAVWDMFTSFQGDIYHDGETKNKTFLHAIFALQLFSNLRSTTLRDYDLAFFNDKPAIELGFRLVIGSDFVYRGYVDVVLINRITGQLLILELKTTDIAHEAKYKNSGQALGYSIFTRKIAPNQSHFDVLYLIYEARGFKYEAYKFTKPHAQRALWMQNLLADCSIINVYGQFESWPMHGESCFDFRRPCSHFDLCHMSNKALIPAEIPVIKEDDKYDFELHLSDLLSDHIEEVSA